MASFKPAYLIHGDDHGRIGERRAALRALAESESGCNGVECFEGDAATPAAIALALDAMTFAIGRRFLVIDGAERWKDAEVEEHLAPALQAIAPDTTVAFFGRDEGRFKVSPKLAAAVKKAGGVVATEQVLKAKELPRWLQGEAEKLGVRLDRDGAQALVVARRRAPAAAAARAREARARARPGHAHRPRRRRGDRRALLRAPGVGARRRARRRRRPGRDAGVPHALGPGRVRRPARRAARAAACATCSRSRSAWRRGRPRRRSRPRSKGSPWQTDKRIAEARRSDAQRLSRALETLADLELASHGGSELSDPTEAIRAIARIAA